MEYMKTVRIFEICLTLVFIILVMAKVSSVPYYQFTYDDMAVAGLTFSIGLLIGGILEGK